MNFKKAKNPSPNERIKRINEQRERERERERVTLALRLPLFALCFATRLLKVLSSFFLL